MASTARSLTGRAQLATAQGTGRSRAGAVFAHVTIREIVVPAISAGLGDDLLDIDLRWRQ